MNAPAESLVSATLPTDLAAAHAMILAERQARIDAQAEALAAKAAASSTEATIAHLKLMIAKLKRELYGQHSERTVRLIDQMELQLEELEAKRPRTNSPRRRCRASRRCRHRCAAVRDASLSRSTFRASGS